MSRTITVGQELAEVKGYGGQTTFTAAGRDGADTADRQPMTHLADLLTAVNGTPPVVLANDVPYDSIDFTAFDIAGGVAGRPPRSQVTLTALSQKPRPAASVPARATALLSTNSLQSN